MRKLKTNLKISCVIHSVAWNLLHTVSICVHGLWIPGLNPPQSVHSLGIWIGLMWAGEEAGRVTCLLGSGHAYGQAKRNSPLSGSELNVYRCFSWSPIIPEESSNRVWDGISILFLVIQIWLEVSVELHASHYMCVGLRAYTTRLQGRSLRASSGPGPSFGGKHTAPLADNAFLLSFQGLTTATPRCTNIASACFCTYW